MFVRKKISKNSPKTAIQLVENVRVGKKVKQRIIRHFGTAINEDEVRALTKLALIYKAQLQAQSGQLSLFEKDTPVCPKTLLIHGNTVNFLQI